LKPTSPARWYAPIIAFIHWFDTSAAPPAAAGDPRAEHVDWLRVIPFFAMHAMCLGVIWVGVSWIAVAAAVALYAIRMFAITGFYHRYFSHRTFKTSRFWQFVFALIGSSAVQRGPLWWAAHHRHHHRHSDQEPDVHSPVVHSFLWSHMLWFTSKANFAVRWEEVKDLAKFPELRFLDRFDILVPILLGFAMFFLGIGIDYYFPELETSGMQMLTWGFFISTVLLFHGTCTINSLSHQIGTQRYKTGDQSRNSLLLALITFGEGWHNNHHFYPASTRQGFYWWEIDVTYYLLRMLAFFGIVWDLRTVPEHVRAGKPEGAAHAAG
jgi:stearoyl-CoA desaturase (delta-9 desaturase)